jgi:hypothetical protein
MVSETDLAKASRGEAPPSADPLAAVCSILVGLSYVAVAVFLFLEPARKAANDAEFLAMIARDTTPTKIRYGAYAVGAVFAYGAIPAIAERARGASPSLVRWMSNLAYLSFGVTAMDNVRLVVFLPKLAAAHAAADATAQATLAMNKTLLGLDPATVLRFGALGAWILTVSLLGRRRGTVPRGAAAAGVATAATLGLTVIGMSLELKPLIMLGAGLGGFLLLPLWFIWIGLTLRKTI